MKFNIIYSLFLFILLISCSEDTRNHKYKSNVIIPESLIKKAKTIDKEDFFRFYREITLETKSECLIGNVEQIIFVEDKKKIILLSDKDILVFDSNGKFINKIGTIGNGPLEYLHPSVIAYNDNVVAVYSNSSLKIVFFTIEGVATKELILSKFGINCFDINSMCFDGKDLYLYTNSTSCNLGPNDTPYRVIKLKNCEIVEKGYQVFEDRDMFIGPGKIFGYGNKILFNGVYNGKIYEIYPTNDDVFEFTNIGVLFDPKIVNKSKNPDAWIMDIENQKKHDFILNFGKIKDFIFITTKNNRNILLDSGGNIIADGIKLNYNELFPKGYDKNGVAYSYGFEIFNEGLLTLVFKANTTSGGSFNANPNLLVFKINI